MPERASASGYADYLRGRSGPEYETEEERAAGYAATVQFYERGFWTERDVAQEGALALCSRRMREQAANAREHNDAVDRLERR